MKPVEQAAIKDLLLAIIRDDKANGGLLSTDTLQKADVLRSRLGIEIPMELAG